MKPNAKGKTAYDLVTDADAKAALRSRPFIFFLSHKRTIVQQYYEILTFYRSFLSFLQQQTSWPLHCTVIGSKIYKGQ